MGGSVGGVSGCVRVGGWLGDVDGCPMVTF